MIKRWMQAWMAMGALRVMLHCLALLFMMILPFSEPSWHPQGIEVIFGAVVPAVAPMIIIVIMLDVLMSKVYQSDTELLERKQHFSRIIRTHLCFAALLLILWLEAFNEALF